MLQVIDGKLIGSRTEMIKHFENILNFLDEKEHIEKIERILEEVKNSSKNKIKIEFDPSDDNFHVV